MLLFIKNKSRFSILVTNLFAITRSLQQEPADTSGFHSVTPKKLNSNFSYISFEMVKQCL